MIINAEILKRVYELAKRKDSLCYINEYVGKDEEEEITYEDFKDYIKNNIISGLQYDLNVCDELLFEKLITIEGEIDPNER